MTCDTLIPNNFIKFYVKVRKRKVSILYRLMFNVMQDKCISLFPPPALSPQRMHPSPHHQSDGESSGFRYQSVIQGSKFTDSLWQVAVAPAHSSFPSRPCRHYCVVRLFPPVYVLVNKSRDPRPRVCFFFFEIVRSQWKICGGNLILWTVSCTSAVHDKTVLPQKCKCAQLLIIFTESDILDSFKSSDWVRVASRSVCWNVEWKSCYYLCKPV